MSLPILSTFERSNQFFNKYNNEINSNGNDMNHVHDNIGCINLMYTCCVYIGNYFLKIFRCIFLYLLVVLIPIVSLSFIHTRIFLCFKQVTSNLNLNILKYQIVVF